VTEILAASRPPASYHRALTEFQGHITTPTGWPVLKSELFRFPTLEFGEYLHVAVKAGRTACEVLAD
jgi:hypothetical protein